MPDKDKKEGTESLIIIYQNKKDGSIGVTGAPDVIKASTTCSYLFGQALVALSQRHVEKGKFSMNLMQGVKRFQFEQGKLNFRNFLQNRFRRRF